MGMEGKMNHTPGPWAYTREEENHSVDHSEKGQAIAEVSTYTGELSIKEALANAQLIAAEPEILEALKLCVPELRGWMRNHGEDIRTVEAIEKATAAIMKAERS